MTAVSGPHSPDLSARNNAVPGAFHDDTMEMPDISTADHSRTQRAAYFTTPPIIDDPWAAIRTHDAEGSSVRTQADMDVSFREDTPVMGSLIRTHSEMELDFQGETPVVHKRQVIEKRDEKFLREQLTFAQNRIAQLRHQASRLHDPSQYIKDMQASMDAKFAAGMATLEKRMEENKEASRQQYQRLFQEQLEATAHTYREELQQMHRSRDVDKERELETRLRANREEVDNIRERLQAEKERDLAAMEARWSSKLKEAEQAGKRLPLRSPESSRSQKSHGKPSIQKFMTDLRNNRKSCSGTPVLVARTEAANSDSASEESDQSQGIDSDSQSTTDEEPGSDEDVADTRRRSSRGSGKDPMGVLTTALTALLQQAMESSRGQNPATPMRRRRGRKSKDEGVEVMKMAETSEVRSVFLGIARQVFKNTFQVDGDDDFVAHQSADPTAVKDHENGGEGPDKRQLRFNMRAGARSGWNRAVLLILMKQMKKACRKSRLRVPERSEAYYLDLLQQRFERARTAWKRGQPRREDDQLESPSDVERRLLGTKEAQLKSARTRERRVAKYQHRISTVSEVIHVKEQEDAVDTDNWKWLKTVLVHLGHDGMSSEESDVDNNDIEVTYRPRVVPWRRDIENELKIIDDQYRRIARTQNRRGPQPSRRIRDRRNVVSQRDPVCGLPYIFYDEDWLRTKTPGYVRHTLKLSTERFKWRMLAIN